MSIRLTAVFFAVCGALLLGGDIAVRYPPESSKTWHIVVETIVAAIGIGILLLRNNDKS